MYINTVYNLGIFIKNMLEFWHFDHDRNTLHQIREAINWLKKKKKNVKFLIVEKLALFSYFFSFNNTHMRVCTFVRLNSIACRHDNNNLFGVQITSDSREIVTAQLSWMHKCIIAGKLHARMNALRCIAGLFKYLLRSSKFVAAAS